MNIVLSYFILFLFYVIIMNMFILFHNISFRYSHQCVMPLAPSYIDDKNQQNIPVVVIIGNLTKSTKDSVSLLKHSEGYNELKIK